MTFCGALALQAFLAGRKVRDAGDNRTNIYLLGLAHSSAGKDWIRKLNAKILHEIGLSSCLGDRLASGEGIQDTLFVDPCMLFQTDEVDGILQSINKAKDARHESIMNTLLSLYSSSNSIFAMRPRAGKPNPGVIDQPNLVLFGTAIPNHYYEALSERMLTNGFFGRMIILEAGKRSEGQEPGLLRVSERVLATAKWWADFPPGTGNLDNWHPVPVLVEHSNEVIVVTEVVADTGGPEPTADGPPPLSEENTHHQDRQPPPASTVQSGCQPIHPLRPFLRTSPFSHPWLSHSRLRFDQRKRDGRALLHEIPVPTRTSLKSASFSESAVSHDR